MKMSKSKKRRQKNMGRLRRKRALAYQNLRIFDGINPRKDYVPIKCVYGKDMKNTLLMIIINSGEIPTDLYELLNIPEGTFRAYISDLYADDLARIKINDRIHTYLLTSHAKRMMKDYRPFIRTPNSVTSRKRHIRLARLNAYFWGLGISVFRHQNPSAENIANNSEAQQTLRFYNSYYLKPAVTEHTENIRRSKSFGLLTGLNKHFMVFYEPEDTEFYYEEDLYKITVSRYIGTEVKDMLLILDSVFQAMFWLHFLFNFNDYFSGESPIRLFEKIRIFVMDEYAQSALYVLLNEEKLEKQIAKDYNLDAYNERYDFLLTLNVYKLYYLIAHAKNNPEESMSIITTPYLMDIVNAWVKDTQINVYYLRKDDWDKYIDLLFQ